MVERRPLLTFVAHAVLIIGAAIVAFPIYITFVASTHSFQDIMQVPMPLLPGEYFWENYKQVLIGGTTTGSRAAVDRMLLNSTCL